MDFVRNQVYKLLKKQYENHRSLEQNMNGLKRKLEDLKALKKDTESRMRAELHPRKKLKEEVHQWLGNVERINGEIQNLDQRVNGSVFSRGSQNETVLKKIQEVQELLQQGRFDQGLVVDDPKLIGQALRTTSLLGDAAGNCRKEIWGHLMDDDIQKIGVWGMGGVGKTSIMKLINNQLLTETEKFDIVIWVTLSKEMNIFKIQKGISLAMGQTLDEDEDETIRAGKLCEMLAQKGRYVLILDDLWNELSLEQVGIPEPSNGSKLVVTTRNLDVCRYLDCKDVRMPTLSKEDALSLFLEKVGGEVLNNPGLLPIVESIVKHCAGLPLAIVIVGSRMKGINNVSEWRNALNELSRRVGSVTGLDEKVLQQLQFSYDHLEDQLKHCFLCCMLFPEDWDIYCKELIQLWINEGLVQEMDSQQAEFDQGYTILNKLKNNCLLENGLFEDEVKLHDLVRDMALRITSVKPRFLSRAGKRLKEIPHVQEWAENLDKVSLMQNEGLRIPSQMSPPKCQMLTTLLLSSCRIKSIPDCFFEQMKGLKVLDLSCNDIECLPSSISNLEALTVLLLSECQIKSIPDCFFEQMKGLKVLNLSWNDIEYLPSSVSNLEALTVLLLLGCRFLEKVPSFSKLQALKKLNLDHTSLKELPHGMESLININQLAVRVDEIPCGILSKLSCLKHLKVSDPFLLRSNNAFVRGEEIAGLRKLEYFYGRFYDLNELNTYLQALQGRRQWPLEYFICVGGQSFSNPVGLKRFIGLSDCKIYRDGVKFPSNLQSLHIENSTIVDFYEEEAFFPWFIPEPNGMFSSLKEIHVWHFQRPKMLFSFSWVLRNIQNLEVLKVWGCEQMEEVIASEIEFPEKEGTSSSNTIELSLPKLRRLELWDLPELKSICSANTVMVCDSLQAIGIKDCPKLRRIPLYLPLRDDG